MPAQSVLSKSTICHKCRKDYQTNVCCGWRYTINKSTLSAIFRLDLVPINRSVGLKAKPTKPVTEVLRPVVAKYGLHLGDLVARIVSD